MTSQADGQQLAPSGFRKGASRTWGHQPPVAGRCYALIGSNLQVKWRSHGACSVIR